MKTIGSGKIWRLLGAGMIGVLSAGAFSARGELEVTASVRVQTTAEFYQPLLASGTWIEVGAYGRCWRPAGIAVEWRPYCDGYWVWTDCGWFWASDEPWAWACYHYGWWTSDPVFGWIWVPGIEWAPAWVTWRVGGGYIGWAPLAPRGVRIAAPQFVFVQEARFTEPLRPSTVVVNNSVIFGKTTVVDRVTRETRKLGGASGQKVVINEGPSLAVVEKAASRKVRVVPIQEAARRAAPPVRSNPGARPSAGQTENGTAVGKPAPAERIPAPAPTKGRSHEHEKQKQDEDHGRGRP